MSSCNILNNTAAPAGATGLDIAAQLRSRINRLKGEFYDLKTGRVNYNAMRASTAFGEYKDAAAMLRVFNPRQLAAREERLAFWINLYNALVIDGIIEMEIRGSVKEAPRFFRRICYQIGDSTFTPDDIEHGILRGNRRPPHGIQRPFSHSDPRLALIIDPPDPRIHFTLVCAGSSCPLINFYSPEKIEEELELAAAAFINGTEVEVKPKEERLLLSPIFKWYSLDFGGRKGVLATIARYLSPGAGRDSLIENMAQLKVKWKDYDWRLNG